MASKLSEVQTVVNNGNIVVFPVAGRAGDIERCARELDDKHGIEAADYWRAECRKLAASLSAIGLTEDEVREQVLTFQDEVQGELVRRHEARALAKTRTEKRR